MDYLDANVFLFAALNDRDVGRNARQRLREYQQAPGQAVASILVLDEVVWSLRRYIDSDRSIQEGQRILRLPGVKWVGISPKDSQDALALMEDHGLKPRDALHAAVAKNSGCTRIVSQDEDFDRWPGLPRESLQ